MTSMQQALYAALYEERNLFQYIHFTPHGIVRGSLSRDWRKGDPHPLTGKPQR